MENIRALTRNLNYTLQPQSNLALEATIPMDELQRAIQKGEPNKASGSDGISQDNFNITWDTIKTDILEIFKQNAPVDKLGEGGSSVNKATDYGLEIRDRIPMGTRFFALPERPWRPPSLL